MRYLVVIEQADDGTYAAYVPDMPGCVAAGQASSAEAKRAIGEAIALHIEGMQEDGLPIPEPTTQADYVESVA